MLAFAVVPVGNTTAEYVGRVVREEAVLDDKFRVLMKSQPAAITICVIVGECAVAYDRASLPDAHAATEVGGVSCDDAVENGRAGFEDVDAAPSDFAVEAAARSAGIPRGTLYRLMKSHGLDGATFRK